MSVLQSTTNHKTGANAPSVVPVAVATGVAATATQNATPKQVLKEGGNFLKCFPLNEIEQYRQMSPDELYNSQNL